MSENPMGGFAAPGPELPEEQPASGRDPKVLIGGGIGLAVVAIVAGYLLLGGGGSSSTPTSALPATVPHVTATPTPTATGVTLTKATPAVRSFKGDVGRDPFQALITAPPAPTTVAAAAAAPKSAAPLVSVSPTGVPIGVGLPTTSVSPLPTIPVVPTTAPAPTTTTPAVLVVLKAITAQGTTPEVVVDFDGKSYTLKTGDTAGTNLMVSAIAPDDGTATFQLGDQRFDLHIGQSYVD